MSKLTKALTAAAGNAGGTLGYVEDVFSTYLFTPTGGVDTHVNGIDLAGEGGMVWQKNRSGSGSHIIYDTERGLGAGGGYLSSNNTNTQSGSSTYFTSFNSDGFTTDANWPSSINVASWSFRKAEKFFDVVTYTGAGNPNASRQITHNLGSVPGFILIKATSTTSDWYVCAKSGATTFATGLSLNSTAAAGYNGPLGAAPTSTYFDTTGIFDATAGNYPNQTGVTYVAYLFASDAGGFGDDGDESIIKCGSYVGTGSATVPNHVELGFEPQYWLIKNTTRAADWWCIDTMRGADYSGTARLFPNTSGAEVAAAINVVPTATGFDLYNNNDSHNRSGDNYIYIAIRRPMKTPESGTEVFDSELVTATQATKIVTGIGFSPDLVINGVRSNANYGQQVTDRLRGVNKQLFTEYTSSESTTNGTALVSLDMDGFTLGADTGGTGWNAYSGYTSVKWAFKRATGFFDVVAYSGTGVARTVNHNLGVVPELIILKGRSGPIAFNWPVYSKSILNTESLFLNYPDGKGNVNNTYWNSTTPTNTNFSLGSSSQVNASGGTFIAYLFATLAGVSKVGSYTGTGSNVDVDCGFSAGARFILIKRTDSTGDWYVWDSVRGIVAGNDPYLLLNSAAAEVTSTDYIDPLASGFTVTSNASGTVNVSGGNYIFLAIS